MDKEKLKLIVKNLELLVDSLKSEIYSDVESYIPREIQEERLAPFIDYEECFDDDGYPD